MEEKGSRRKAGSLYFRGIINNHEHETDYHDGVW